MNRFFRYLKRNPYFDLWYKKSGDLILKVYINVDWAESIDDRKSNRGGTFFLGDRLVS